MNYFVNNDERRGTCYHEFIRGEWDGKTLWSYDSMYLRDDYISDLRLCELVFNPSFAEFGGKFNRWGQNTVNRALWESMLSKAVDTGGEVMDLFFEISPWVEKSLSAYETFTILGM